MSPIELASFAAAIASLVLAVTAIWLCVFFYRMSSQLSEGTKEAAKGIGASVDRLEKLFDKLYADTFSMMKDTVSDMRKHIWPEAGETEDKIAQESEKKADDKVKALKNDLDKELSELLKRQQVADKTMTSMQGELALVMDRAISESRKLETEAREETIRDHIVSIIRASPRPDQNPTAEDIVDGLRGVFSAQRVVEEMKDMKRDCIIDYEGEGIGRETRMRVVRHPE